MKLILYAWGSNLDDMLKYSLIAIGHEVVVFRHKCEHYTRDLKMGQELISLIHKINADAVISYDYFPIISMVCNTSGILYYSWVYDCPHYTLFAKTAGYECNRIGCFDRGMVEKFNRLGIKTIFHLPLGVDWPDVRNDVVEKYKSDVSFIGSLYTGEYDYYDQYINDDVLKESADECVRKQCFEYKKDYINGFWENEEYQSTSFLTDKIREILRERELLPGEEYIEDIEYIFSSSFLEKKVTIEERKRLLNAVTEIDCDFRLYTGSDLKDEPRLADVCNGYVDYNRIMPKVFKSSRINLNITLRSIKTGIPLRALDIMGCGGFLLSNYQSELAECFDEGKEIVMFYSLDDCIEKIKYYLEHEEERSAIAFAGNKAVKERFSCKEQLENLLK